MIKLARPVKCPICSQYGLREDMILENRRYYHKEYCFDRFKKEQEATRIENEQWDELYQYIIKFHDLVTLSVANITRLKHLRAGFEYKKGKKIPKWRTGPDYALMLEAYRLSEKNNLYAMSTKIGDWNDVNQVNYTISTMVGHLNDAWKIRLNKKKQMEAEKRVEKQESKRDQSLPNKNTYSNKRDDLDISDFL
ncbi:hypothetical protein ACU1JV_00455 [Paenibacillus sp. T2-29]